MSRVRLRSKLNERGFSPIEVLLAATIFGFLVTALIGGLVYGRNSTATAGERYRAVLLAEEGVEAARSLRDASYTSLSDGTYGLVQNAGRWVLSSTPDTTGIFTRQLNIASVDTSRKDITSSVSWSRLGSGTAQTSVTTRLTNWRSAMVPPTSWTNATLAGGLNLSGTNDAVGVATQGNYAYVVRNGNTLNFTIVDVSNPATPTAVSTITVANGNLTSIAVSGDYAYITSADDNSELTIVNISNPAAPTVVGRLNSTGKANAEGVYVVGDYAYVGTDASKTGDFLVVDVSNKAAPVVEGSYSLNNNIYDVYVSGNYAYLATKSDTQELLVLNVSNPALPTLASSLNLPGNNDAMAIDGFGTTVFIGQGSAFVSVNVADPLHPTVADTLTLANTVNDVTISADHTYAFLATSVAASDFQVVNISDLANMTIARTVDSPGNGLLGVSYDGSLNIVVGVGATDTQEVSTFKPN